MEQICLTYGLPKETVAAIMMLYKNMKVKVCSPDGDTDYFDIVAGTLQGDTITPYLFIISLDYMLRMVSSWQWKEAQTITDMDYANDIALQANSPTQAESQLHGLE